MPAIFCEQSRANPESFGISKRNKPSRSPGGKRQAMTAPYMHTAQGDPGRSGPIASAAFKSTTSDRYAIAGRLGVDNFLAVRVFARRPIKKGQQLSFDYDSKNDSGTGL
jgi:hypothetical protein